ncbi:Non-specific lipid-transfer protein [Linum perenne]
MAAANYKLQVVCVAALMAAVLVVSSHGAVTCGQVTSSVAPCFSYLLGSGPLVPGCCNGVRFLNSAANNTPNRQTACRCLKTIAGSVRGINLGLAAGLPGKCRVNVPFPISLSVDCNKGEVRLRRIRSSYGIT